MDVDHALGEFGAQRRWQNLHVARQDDDVGPMFLDQAFHLGEGRGLVLGIDRNMEVRNAMPLDHATQIVVVGDHAGNLAIEFIAVPTVQQIGQAMRLTTGHQHHALLLRRIGDTPLHGELAGNRRERLLETIQIERQRVGTDFVTHEEPATLRIGVVTGFGNPAVIGREEITDFGNDADAVRAGDD